LIETAGGKNKQKRKERKGVQMDSHHYVLKGGAESLVGRVSGGGR